VGDLDIEEEDDINFFLKRCNFMNQIYLFWSLINMEMNTVSVVYNAYLDQLCDQ